MRPVSVRLVMAAVLATVLAPTALCLGAMTSSGHGCCTTEEAAWQDGSGEQPDCCIMSAPAPNQAAVVTSNNPGSEWATPAVTAHAFTAAPRQASQRPTSAAHSPPG